MNLVKFHNFFLVLIFALLTACQTVTDLNTFQETKKGMDKNQVLEILGSPNRTERKDGRDWWYYTIYQNNFNYDRMVVFDSGKVIYAGRVTIPKFIKEADKIDSVNKKTSDTLEFENERERVNQVVNPPEPPPESDAKESPETTESE